MDSKSNPPKLVKIDGISFDVQYLPGDWGYSNARMQYALSSEGAEHDMKPGLIVKARGLEDIQKVIKHTLEPANKGMAIAVRSGGHQYSGASSTGATNILLDVSGAFRNKEDLYIVDNVEGTFVRASVSWRLHDLIDFLKSKGCFVPTGQCTHVGLGGHAQTGGYGQLARSFGLLADHIVSIEYVDSTGTVKGLSRSADADRDLFFAWMGGSPGNLGILTHITMKVYRDEDYTGSRGMRVIYSYDKQTLKELLDQLVAMGENPNFPRNYDLCVSVLSAGWFLYAYPGAKDEFDDLSEFFETEPESENPEQQDPEIEKDNENNEEDLDAGAEPSPQTGIQAMKVPPAVIVVYAQWVKLTVDGMPDENWFKNLAGVHWSRFRPRVKNLENVPMSQIIPNWLFTEKREFLCPYVKRTQMTNSTTLSQDQWAEWMAGRIDQKARALGFKISAQIQCFGGNESMFRRNGEQGTTCHSWRRDSTLGATFDCFYWWTKALRKAAEDWQHENDEQGIGDTGKFCKEDRRLLWGSFGEYDLDKAHKYYYESEEMYQRVQAARKELDPNGTFTPNPFCVKAA